MKSFYLLLLTLIGALAFPHPYDGKVLILSPENFVIAQNDFRFILINFYDPDAISSQDSFQQEFALAAEKADKTYPGLRLAKMDTVLYESFTQQFEPIESSTAKLFIDGKNALIEYNGRIDAEEIVAWLEDQIASRLIELEYSNELNQLIKEDRNVALYFGSRDTYEFAQYLGVSTLYKDYISFAYANEESIKQDFELEDNSFTVFRNHNEEMSLLESPFSVENLQRFINTYTYPTVMNFDGTARTLVFNKKTDTIFLIRRSDSAGDDAEEAFRNLAESYRHHLAFIIGNVGEQNTELLIDLLGVDRSNLPTIMILHFSDNRKKYRLDSEPSQRNIQLFLLNFLEGNLVPFYKSAPLPDPEREYDGHVKIVVHDTYKEIVFDESKDVMVEFYSPKCGHCQAFAPIYESLAEKMENTKDLLIVKVDATVNDIEDINPPGYPHVIFYPRDHKKTPIDFAGERKVENLITFIQQHATVKIDI